MYICLDCLLELDVNQIMSLLEAWFDTSNIPKYSGDVSQDVDKVKTQSRAAQIIGQKTGLSGTSKMPVKSINIDPEFCHTGSELCKVPGSVCSICYAKKPSSAYQRYSHMKSSFANKMKGLTDPEWVPAMVLLVSRTSSDYFRWHDAGDIQSMSHFNNIIAVIDGTPNTLHWLPTKESSLVRAYSEPLPNNLCLRLSNKMIGDFRPIDGYPSSCVSYTEEEVPDDVLICPSAQYNNTCGPCRACWDNTINQVCYIKH